MNIVYVYSDNETEWNSSAWNCITPAKAVNEIEGNTATTIYINDFITPKSEQTEALAKADIIVVERNFFGDTLTMMQYWKVRNKTIVAIFDDAYDYIHPSSPVYQLWKNSISSVTNKVTGERKTIMIKPHILDQFKWGLRIVKAIQVPSKMLAQDWAKYGETFHIQNYIDADRYIDVKPLIPKATGEIVIGWQGSATHFHSFMDSGIMEALKKIGKLYPNVKVMIGGGAKKVYDKLEVENKVFNEHVPDDQFLPLTKSFDIGIAPLFGDFDKRRSWAKVLEYMALDIPWIATNYETYHDMANYGILTDNGYKGWLDSFKNMIENYQVYKQKAETEGHAFAMKQTTDNNIKNTIALYEKILQKPYPVW